MDFLSKTLEKKRREQEQQKEEVLKKVGATEETAGRPKKFLKRGEKEKLLQEKKNEIVPQEQASQKQEVPNDQEKTNGNFEPEPTKSEPPPADGKAILPKLEVIRRLRARGQPITFFGETDFQREERLRLLEAQESEESNEFGRNDFKDAINEIDEEDKEAMEKKKPEQNSDSEDEKDFKMVDPSAPLSVSEFILGTFKKVLKDWQEELDERSVMMKKSAQGKIQTAIFKQTRKYLRPLFKLLRARTLADDIRHSLHEIASAIKEKNYVYANDVYLRLAIGNSPWPMGVTMVGIHERSAREKIFSNQIAHVLNDETQRKYIQSVKRLISFSQKKYPVAPSQMVG